MERKSIQTLKGRQIAKIERSTRHPGHFEFLSATGKVIFSVKSDGIFDQDGNYFEES